MLLDLARGLDEDRRDSTAALEASFADVPVEALGEPAAVSEDDQVDEAGDSAAETLPTLETEAGSEATVRDDIATVALAPATAPPPPSPAQAKPGPPPPPVEAPPSPPPRTVLLVDDEDDVRGIIGGLFRIVGYEVIEAEDPESAVKAARTLHKAGTVFLLLVDLGMPATGGSSFQGGFEVVKRLWKMHLRPPVLMMTDSLNPGLRARARQMGISSFVFKPGLSKLDRKQFEADLRAFATRLVQDILPSMGRGEAARKPSARLAGSELAASAPASAADYSRELGLLQERLAELRKQSDPTQIAMMVMRVAREFFERGVLLLVKNEELRGLGGFGMVPREHKIGLLVREIVIPLGDESIFRDVVEGQKTYVGALPEGKWTKTLVARLGRFKAGGAVLVPLLTNRETIAVLYGDNPETGVTPGRLDTLELFINQAGIALENAFLQRKVRGAG
jgi:CheY-like chemotaxis protein